MLLPPQLPLFSLGILLNVAQAAFAYHPSRIFLSDDSKSAYLFSPQSAGSDIRFQFLDTSREVDLSAPRISTLTAEAPFQDTSPTVGLSTFFNGQDLKVLVGDCRDQSSKAELWHYTQGEGPSGTWDQLSLTSEDASLPTSHFLTATFTFSATASIDDASLYMFGGMCPSQSSGNMQNWTSRASYSDDLIILSPKGSSVGSYPSNGYMSSNLTSRGAPVAEAGLTITPLTPTRFSDPMSSKRSVAQQQNFALIGGHTAEAFINMSEIALFSLPEESWSFEGIAQPQGQEKKLFMRSSAKSEVEPRSGHTALLTGDGTKIVVLGGWVGDVATPAKPQVAVLEVGQGYGGIGEWKWTVPAISDNPFEDGHGIYGHGAAMLEGDVMLISGGSSIVPEGSSRRRRQDGQLVNDKMLLFNTTSSAFVDTYRNPASTRWTDSPKSPTGAQESGGPLSTTSQKAGLGAGLALGLGAVAGAVAFYFFFSRRLRRKRAQREKDLRELALGSDKFFASDLLGGGVDGRGGFATNNPRSASWGSIQEKNMVGVDEPSSWSSSGAISRPRRYGEGLVRSNGERAAERTGLLLDTPSPTRGLRRSMHPKGPSYSSLGIGAPASSPFGPSAANGDIHTIAEQDEESEGDTDLDQGGPSKGRKWSKSREQTATEGKAHEGDGSDGVKNRKPRPESDSSDPFKDPPPQLMRSQSELDRQRREQEIKGWIDDWEAAGAAMDSGKFYRQAPSASSTSKPNQRHSLISKDADEKGDLSRSQSPEKSDRTESNLSEQSTMSSNSIQRSIFGSITRNVSMRSASAGYVLFANAAAAMTGRATIVNHPGPPQSSSASLVRGDGSNSTRTNIESRGHGNDNGYDHSQSSSSSTSTSANKRSASLNLNSNASSIRRKNGKFGRSETFSSARTSFGPSQPWEQESLLSVDQQPSSSPTRPHHRALYQDHGYSHGNGDGDEAATNAFETPPESPVKDRNNSMNGNGGGGASGSGPGKRALVWMGSVRRALTGNATHLNASEGNSESRGDVQRRVEEYERKNGGTGVIKQWEERKGKKPSEQQQQPSQMRAVDGFDAAGTSTPPRRAVSASSALWRSKKGAKDWDVGTSNLIDGTSPPLISTLHPNPAMKHSTTSTPSAPFSGGSTTTNGACDRERPSTIRRKAVAKHHPQSQPQGQMDSPSRTGKRSSLTFPIKHGEGAGSQKQTQQIPQNKKGRKESTCKVNVREVNATSSTTVGDARLDAEEGEDWDVEAAAEKRLVQVMFTVPREKLRVVNADLDAMSLDSREGGSDEEGKKGGKGGAGAKSGTM